MATVNTGSLVAIVYSGISPFPGNISGILVNIVDQNRFFVENYTGDTIGSVIAEKYQNPITNLATANVLKLMAVQDFGVQQVTIGDLSTNNSNLLSMAQQFEDRAMIEIKSLAKGLKFFKARG